MAGSAAAARQHDAVAKAAEKLLQALRQDDFHPPTVIKLTQLEQAITQNERFTKEDFSILFGENVTVREAFQQMSQQHDQVTYQDIEQFLEQKGVKLKASFLGYRRKEVKNMFNFVMATQESLLFNATRNQIQERDVERTVGINTYYMGTTDFDLEADDKKLLVEQGKLATKAYLDYYIHKKRPPLKTDAGRLSYYDDNINIYVDEDALTEVIDERDYMEDLKNVIGVNF